ncbi:MAG: glutamine amidotransferase [Gemmatimonadaceae bacterium]
MDSFVEFFFKYRPVVFERGELVLATPRPVLIVLGLVALALALAWVYGRARGKSTPRDRAILTGVRGAIIVIAGIALLRPTLLLSTAVPQKNAVAILIDDSRSMRIEDADGRSRAEVAQRLLGTRDSALARALADRFQLRYFRFSSGAEAVADGHAMTFEGGRTHLGAALDRARQDLSTVPLSGLVVISDGADNSATALAEPLLALKARGVPIYTIGVGQPRFERDIEITRVEVPHSALRGTALVANVLIAQRGYAGRTVQLVAEDGGRIIASQEVTLRGDGEESPVRMRVVTSETGPRQLRFRIAREEGELIADNNGRDALVTVADRTEKVLYVEGEPRFELKFLRRAVRDDRNVRLVALQRTAENKFLRLGVEDSLELVAGFPKTREELFAYRAVILGSVEASFFTVEQMRMLADFVGERGGGLLFLGGRRAFAEGGYAETPLADVMPVEVTRGGDESEEFFAELQISPTPSGAMHPATQLGASEQASLERWKTMPPLSTVNRVVRAKPGATALLVGQSVSGAGGDRQVVLAHQRFGRGKAIAFPVQDSWVWQMHASIPVEDATHETFWRQMLRWLVSDVPDRVGTTAPDHVAPGETVPLRAQVHNEGYLAVNGAAVTASVLGPNGVPLEVPLEWMVDKDGEYRGTFAAPEPGLYRVRVTARVGDTVITGNEDYVVAQDIQQEMFGAAQRPALLERIARETGGRYYTPETVQTLAEDIVYTNSGTTVTEQLDLWDSPALFIALLGLIAVEWLLRRRRGLA